MPWFGEKSYISRAQIILAIFRILAGYKDAYRVNEIYIGMRSRPSGSFQKIFYSMSPYIVNVALYDGIILRLLAKITLAVFCDAVATVMCAVPSKCVQIPRIIIGHNCG